MFTGIITNIGKLVDKSDVQFTFETDETFCILLRNGSSIAVNGVCLTVTRKDGKNRFSVEIMPETQRRTTLHGLAVETTVNLELPVTPTTLLSGHIVQGHVDGVGKLIQIKEEGNSKVLAFQIADELNRYVVTKGSIAINGISLTVIAVSDMILTVGIIPYTWQHTSLQHIQIGDMVNIETDVIAKYVEKLLKKE